MFTAGMGFVLKMVCLGKWKGLKPAVHVLNNFDPYHIPDCVFGILFAAVCPGFRLFTSGACLDSWSEPSWEAPVQRLAGGVLLSSQCVLLEDHEDEMPTMIQSIRQQCIVC